MPSYINFQDDTTYPGAKFRRMVGRQQDLAQGFDDPNSFKVKVSNDNPGMLEAAPGIAWIKDQVGGIYFVERELNPLYVDTVGTSGTIVLRVKDSTLFDGPNELLLQAIPTGSTIPTRSLRLATYTGSGSDAVLTDVRFSTSGQFIVSRSGPANYGPPDVAAMGLDAFSPGTQYTNLTTGLRYVKAVDNTWKQDQGPTGATGPSGATWLSGTAAPTAGLGANGDFYVQDDTRTFLGVTSTNLIIYKKTAGAWAQVGSSPVGGAKWYFNNASTSSTDTKPGDMLLRTDTGDVWQRGASGWGSVVGNLKGPAGPQGIQGPTGSQGPTGATGSQGPAGAQGPQGNPTTVNGKTGASITLTPSDIGSDPAGTAASAITAHSGAADPHGDRADAASKYLPLAGGTLTGALIGTSFTGSGTTQLANLRVGSGSSFGGGTGGMALITAATTVPNANPSANGVVLYNDAGVTKIRQGDGAIIDMVSLNSLIQPSDHGLISWTFDPALVNSSAVSLSTGTLALARFSIRATKTVSSLWYGVATAGSALTASQNVLGIYDSTGVLKGTTVDQSTAMTSIGVKQAALTSSVSLTPGNYWVAFLCNGTTPPQVARGGNVLTGLANVNLASTAYRFGAYGSSLTALPSTLTLASITNVQNGTMWAAVS